MSRVNSDYNIIILVHDSAIQHVCSLLGVAWLLGMPCSVRNAYSKCHAPLQRKYTKRFCKARTTRQSHLLALFCLICPAIVGFSVEEKAHFDKDVYFASGWVLKKWPF